MSIATVVKSEGYTGPDRRIFARRSGTDRRDTLRWEPKKVDRRQGCGRRHEDQVWNTIRANF